MTALPMPADQFWQSIEHAAQSAQDRDAHVRALRTELCKLSLEEVRSFEVAFRPSTYSAGPVQSRKSRYVYSRLIM
jgi:uncharacterized protein DUF4240